MQLDTLLDDAARLAALDRYCVLDTAPEQNFDKITAMVKATMEVPICGISLIAKDRQWFKAIQGLDTRQTTRKVAFCDHTIRNRDSFVVEDATADDRFADNPLVVGAPHIRSYAGVPLMTPAGFNLGALCVIDTKKRTFHEQQIGILRRFAELVIKELEARSASLQDRLTQSLTRQGVLDAMQRQVSIFQQQNQPCSLVLVDIDNFRAINDSHGHNVGDQVLQLAAECCKLSIRGTDIFGRVAGDVFAVVMPGTTAYEATACAERLRGRFSKLFFTTAEKSIVTASFGIADLQRGDSQDFWLASAEGALFTAKKNGRNRCVSAGRPR